MPRTTELLRERRIVADPTSLALLLAGPTGVDLWPGARRRSAGRQGERSGRLLVEADLDPAAAGSPTMLLVRADAPRRTPAAFVLSFGWEPDGNGQQPETAVGGSGTLALGYEGVNETRAALRITLTSPAGSQVDPAREELVVGMAEGFLNNLAAAAEARSHAA